MQEQDSLFTTLHSLRSQIIIPGNCTIAFDVFRLLTCLQELQSMNIAARLYTVSTGRVRDTHH